MVLLFIALSIFFLVILFLFIALIIKLLFGGCNIFAILGLGLMVAGVSFCIWSFVVLNRTLNSLAGNMSHLRDPIPFFLDGTTLLLISIPFAVAGIFIK